MATMNGNLIKPTFTPIPFIDDMEKISDMLILSKEEFLMSYSYLTEEEYDVTAEMIMEIMSSFRQVYNKILNG